MKLAKVRVYRHYSGDKGEVVYEGPLREFLQDHGGDSWWAGQVASDIREYGGHYWDADLLVEPA